MRRQFAERQIASISSRETLANGLNFSLAVVLDDE